MSTRRFTTISPAVFQSDRYLSVSSSARELFFYCLAGPHQTMIGCFRAPTLYIAADLRWKPEDVSCSLDELRNAGLIDFDDVTQEIMVERWFAHSQIATEKHMQGARRMIAEIASDYIRERMEHAFEVFEQSRDKPRNALPDRGNRLTNSTYLNPKGR